MLPAPKSEAKSEGEQIDGTDRGRDLRRDLPVVLHRQAAAGEGRRRLWAAGTRSGSAGSRSNSTRRCRRKASAAGSTARRSSEAGSGRWPSTPRWPRRARRRASPSPSTGSSGRRTPSTPTGSSGWPTRRACRMPWWRRCSGRYFTEGRDISDRQTLLDVVAEAGLDRTRPRPCLSGDEGLEAIRAAEAAGPPARGPGRAVLRHQRQGRHLRCPAAAGVPRRLRSGLGRRSG